MKEFDQEAFFEFGTSIGKAMIDAFGQVPEEFKKSAQKLLL